MPNAGTVQERIAAPANRSRIFLRPTHQGRGIRSVKVWQRQHMSIQRDCEVMEVAKAVREALLDLHAFGTKRPVDCAGKSLQELIAAGALSPGSANFIGAHQVRFHGFKLKPIRSDIPVFDVELADRTPPVHVIGFRDGHAEVTGQAAESPQ